MANLPHRYIGVIAQLEDLSSGTFLIKAALFFTQPQSHVTDIHAIQPKSFFYAHLSIFGACISLTSSSSVTVISIVLLTMDTVAKQLYRNGKFHFHSIQMSKPDAMMATTP